MIDPVKTLENALKIKSESGNEQRMAEYATKVMRELGYKEVYIDEAGNAVGELGNTEKPPSILLVGHIDTVPGEIPVRIESGKLYGRGAVDAKGPFFTFIFASIKAWERLKNENYHIVVAGAVEEESATSKGARYLKRKYETQGKPESIINGEPSAWDKITIGYKGRILIEFIAQCEAGHTAFENAFGIGDKGIQLWNEIKNYCQTYNTGKSQNFEILQPSLRKIVTSSDGLIDNVNVVIGLRLPPGFNIKEFKKWCSLIADNLNGQVKFYGYDPAYKGTKRGKLISAFIKSIRKHGGKPGFKVKSGTSDMNVLGPAFKAPIVAYGPGDSSLDHTPREYIEITEYLKAIDVLSDAIVEYLS